MIMMNDELITLYFSYLISDFGFHIEKRVFDYSAMGNAFVVFKSSMVGIDVTIDRNQALITIGDQLDERREWLEFTDVLKYYAPTLEHAYVFPEKTSGNTWDDVVKDQLLRLASILREYCEPLLKGDLSGMEKIKELEKRRVAKMMAELNNRTSAQSEK